MTDRLSDPVPTIKKTRLRLSLAQKIEVSRRLSNGFTIASVAKEFGCSVRTVKQIKHDSQRYTDLAATGPDSLRVKTVRVPKFPQIESKLFDFVTFARAARMPITASVLQAKAILIRDHLVKAPWLSPAIVKNLTTFSASEGWLCNFIKRNSLRSITMQRHAGSVDVTVGAAALTELRKTLDEYAVECIYNVNETGLFYKLLPRVSYLTEHDFRKSVRGTINMGAKDRVTAYVCTNADGSNKLPTAIIGAVKDPKCFQNRPPPIPYFNQKSAWSDSKTFRRWFYEVFLPYIRKLTSKKVLLLIDRCGPHGADLVDVREQVKILILPPTFTSIHQLMREGIITAFKCSYRHEFIHRLISIIEDKEQLQRSSAHFSSNAGLAEGHDPNLLDVAEITEHSWESVSKQNIARCWMNADILPPGMQSSLEAEHGKNSKVRASQRDKPASQLCKTFSRLKTIIPPNDPVAIQLAQVGKNEIHKWINIEESEAVAESVVNDLMEDLQLDSFNEILLNSDPAEVGVEAESATLKEFVPIPRPSTIAEMFRGLEELAFKSNLPGAILNLRKAKIAFQLACESQRRKESG